MKTSREENPSSITVDASREGEEEYREAFQFVRYEYNQYHGEGIPTVLKIKKDPSGREHQYYTILPDPKSDENLKDYMATLTRLRNEADRELQSHREEVNGGIDGFRIQPFWPHRIRVQYIFQDENHKTLKDAEIINLTHPNLPDDLRIAMDSIKKKRKDEIPPRSFDEKLSRSERREIRGIAAEMIREKLINKLLKKEHDQMIADEENNWTKAEDRSVPTADVPDTKDKDNESDKKNDVKKDSEHMSPGPDTPPPSDKPGGEPPSPDGSSPEDSEGETDKDLSLEEGLTRVERLRQAAIGVARVATGTIATLFGIRLAYTAIQYIQDAWKLRGLKKDQEAIQDAFSQLEYAQIKITEAAEKEESERKSATEKAEEEERVVASALEERIQGLIGRGIITEDSAEKFRSQLGHILEETVKSTKGITQETESRIQHALDTYIQRRTTGTELLKQGLNFGFVLTGLQTLRLFTYGGLSLYQRIQRRLAENERLHSEGRETEMQSIWRDLAVQAPSEFIGGLRDTGTIVSDLVSRERISQKDWTQQTQNSARALGSLALFAGMAGAAFSSGSTGEQINTLLNNLESRGLGNTLADNFVMNMERTTFGLVRHEWFQHTETPAVIPPPVTGNTAGIREPEHPATHGAGTPGAHPEHPPLSPVEQAAAVQHFEKAHTLLGAHKLHIETDAGGTHHIDASFGVHGHFQYLDQLLRRLAVDKMDSHSLHGHGSFDHIDAARVENVVANMRNALLGRHDTPLSSHELHGIAHVTGGKLVIDNYEAFGRLTDRLFGHAQQIITEQSGALHYIDNTSHGVWQKMWDIKMQGEQHVAVEDFSRYHHAPIHHEAPPHTPILDHKETVDTNSPPTESPPVIAPLNPIATSPEASGSPSSISPESTGSISLFTTKDTHGVPHTIIIEETPLVPADHEATPSVTPHEASLLETASASPHANTSAEPKLIINAQEDATPAQEQWTLQTFFEKFTANKFDASFIEGAHEHPDVFALFFMDRLAELRHTYGQDYFKYLTQEDIHDAAENSGNFRMNISELIEGVLHHKKDIIHLNLGHDFTYSATPKE